MTFEQPLYRHVVRGCFIFNQAFTAHIMTQQPRPSRPITKAPAPHAPTQLAKQATSKHSAPLWQLLQKTAAVVQAVRAGRSLTPEIEAVPNDLRPGVQSLAFQVMRQLGRAMALREQLASKAPPPAADALLCTALALSWLDAQAPYPVHTLVNQAVEAARQQKTTQAQSGFINACLRRFIRER